MNTITSTITMNVHTNDQGQFVCQMSSVLDPPRADTTCYGQTAEHAIAITLEQLASSYREMVELEQNRDLDAVEFSETGKPIKKRYHIVLHYENIRETKSKFHALEETILGNSVIEDGTISLIEINKNLPVKLI